MLKPVLLSEDIQFHNVQNNYQKQKVELNLYQKESYGSY